MARRSLRPQLNQIRSWVRQGRTDAWIAHQLEVTVKDIDGFKREHDLVPAEGPDGPTGDPALAGPIEDEEPDLRAEDEALVAAELDAEPDDDEPSEEKRGGETEGDEAGSPRRSRRRGRRGGRGRRETRERPSLEGTFDHGEEGYGLWLDPAVGDDPVYAEHWAGHRPVTVTLEPDRIVIRRAGDGASEEDTGEDETGARARAGAGDGELDS